MSKLMQNFEKITLFLASIQITKYVVVSETFGSLCLMQELKRLPSVDIGGIKSSTLR